MLIAYDSTTENYFVLDRKTFNNVGNAPVQSGSQQINIDTTRGYHLADNDQFNDFILTTGAKVAQEQFYEIRYAQKVSWQDWIAKSRGRSVTENATPIFETRPQGGFRN